ncbi:MAG: DUF1016 N-terminal domain-containing protein [Propionibacteriaceae bacterium]|jgi:hypothetical protein|nr:DUF1016 N-terminal domain-containing protein [Propionibacteriaceae bacterium]
MTDVARPGASSAKPDDADRARLDALTHDVREIILDSRGLATRSVSSYRVLMYWKIGQRIVEDEQGGAARAEYGAYVIRGLAGRIEPEFGSGFSVRQLELARQTPSALTRLAFLLIQQMRQVFSFSMARSHPHLWHTGQSSSPQAWQGQPRTSRVWPQQVMVRVGRSSASTVGRRWRGSLFHRSVSARIRWTRVWVAQASAKYPAWRSHWSVQVR